MPKKPERVLNQPPSLLARFDPERSVNSGQVFLWEKIGQNWYGIHADSVVKFSRQQDGVLVFESFPEDRQKKIERSMFRLDDDIDAIFAEISRDAFVQELISLYAGLRLMRQDPAQCIISFVCASNTNIPMIRMMLGRLSKTYGQQVIADGIEFHTFPPVQALYKASESDLRACGLGYRAKAVRAAAGAMAEGSLDLEWMRKASYDEAKTELLKVYGIGPKIADCILLFSLDKLDAFPIDVWIARALASHYDWLATSNNKEKKTKVCEKLTERQYAEASGAARRYFGQYAGYAQQFLYYHMRQGAGKKW
ncbi:MAG TPA: DNA glycosylase [Nitrososphaera sp.]|nr:DNA glycosylase [Nitrososphaera sp.]